MDASQIQSQADEIVKNIKKSKIFKNFDVVPSLLEHYNIFYSEKQVRRIDANFFDYSLGTRFRLNVPHIASPKGLRYLIRKFFSGDVSGDIGEALFAYFLIEEMNVSSYCIGHTRPEKRKGFLTPDFIVWDSSFRLASLLNSKKYPLPVLGEVKGFTGDINSTRISHGLSQLKMLISNTLLLGILFLAIRNEERKGYDIYIVRART